MPEGPPTTLTEPWTVTHADANRDAYAAAVASMADAVDGLPEAPTCDLLHGSPDRYGPRDGGHAPESDPHNAWVTRFELGGDESGPLTDLTLGLKDSIAVAGYPCTLGSDLLAGFTPSVDATVTARLLDAGATLSGKHNMDSFAMGDAGEIQDFGPTTSPHDDTKLAGGSSSGSAAAVAAGECDAALGTDQAGSVRNPAAWCGLVGIKPTHGAVPYTGVAGMDRSIDHVGILSRDVETNTRVLAAIAGTDVQNGVRLDPRQPADYDGFTPGDASAEPGDSADFTVGVLAEGFDWPFLDPAVESAVRDTLSSLADNGTSVVDVSVPEHAHAPEVVGVAAAMGGSQTLRTDGVGRGAGGWYWDEFAAALGEARRADPGTLPPSVLASLQFTAELEASERRTAYARAKNCVLAAERAYDRALADCDVLALPTSPTRALEPASAWPDAVDRLGWLPVNTGLFNGTGHPAISVPAPAPDGLPVGLQFVAPHFEEARLYRAARAVDALA
jgi:amidase